MVKIFIGKDNLESKIIGRRYPQIIGTDCERLLDENNKFIEIEKFDTTPNNEYSVKIAKGAKLTDILSSFMTNHSPIISETFVDLLMKFGMPKHKIIPVKIIREKEIITEKKYFIIHFVENDINHINFKKSSFDYFTGGAGLDKSLLKFDNYEDYMKKLKNNEVKMAIIQNVVMDSTLKNDLFFLDIFDGSARFFTSRLKQAIDEQQITGLSFDEVGYIEQ